MINNKLIYKKLVNNTIMFTIGSFGSKLLQFLFVPLYTYLLSTEEYGEIDLFNTTIMIVVPFITLSISESIIRYLAAKEISKTDAISVGMVIYIFSTVLCIICLPIFYNMFTHKISILLVICLIINSYNSIYQNYLKADGFIQAYTISGILNTIVFIISNIVMLIILKLGVSGYIYSMLISALVTSIYITISGKIINNLSIKSIDIKKLKVMLYYCIPLIPNNLMWWIMNAGNKYIIKYNLGLSANGIYAISSKLPTIITTIFSIFMQAWCLTAIEEFKKEKNEYLFSKIFITMLSILTFFTTLIIIFSKTIVINILKNDYSSSYIYTPLLCVATLLNCIATFLGVIYIISKNTKKAVLTTFLGAITNLMTNIILVKRFGLIGISIGTIFGYLIVTIIRTKDTKKEIDVNLDVKRSFFAIIVILIDSIIYIKYDGIISSICNILSLIVVTVLYFTELKGVVKIIINKMIKIIPARK